MRELILGKIKEAIEQCDEEIVENYGSYKKFSKMNDEDLLEVFEFLVGFRG